MRENRVFLIKLYIGTKYEILANARLLMHFEF